MNNPAANTLNALTSFVTGSSWIVTWYSQVLGADNAPQPFDVNRAIAYQPYRKINNLELMVTTPLQHQQDPETKEFEVTGTAIAYAFLTPNAGDTFIAQVDNGQMAIFNVTRSEKATYMKNANYSIDYKLVCYIDPVLVANLDAKSIQVLEFVKGLLTDGQNPLLSANDYALFGGLQKLYVDLVSFYFRDFFSQERQTFLVPDQDMETYDHFLTRAMVDIVATDDSLRLPMLRMPAVEGDRAMVNVTIWDAVLRTDRSLLLTGIQEMGVLPTVMFRNFPNLTGIYYTGIDNLIYPKDPRTDVDRTYDGTYPSGWPIQDLQGDGTLRYKSLQRILQANDPTFFATQCQCVEKADGTTQLPVIVPVTQDDYYVFTQAFYNWRGGTLSSQLEVLVKGAIDTQTIDRTQLIQIGTQAFNWPNLERFYYIPMILALIRISLGSN